MVKTPKKPKNSDESIPENPLFEKRPKVHGIGKNIQPKRDLYRYVRWPEYILFQRKRRALLATLRMPPALNHFRNPMSKFHYWPLFRLLKKYKPEFKEQKRVRLENEALGEKRTSKPIVLKYGLKHVTSLIENNKAKLVVIAYDVNPIELVLWLPALCRSMNVPYAIIRDKHKLGTFTNKKNCAVVALTDILNEDMKDFEMVVKMTKEWFDYTYHPRWWRYGTFGEKTLRKIKVREYEFSRKFAHFFKGDY